MSEATGAHAMFGCGDFEPKQTKHKFEVGQVWRAKLPRAAGSMFRPLINDRQIRWIDSCGTQVQYDSPSVAPGRHYPKVSMAAFEKWAAREVTAELPENGDWATWDHNDRSRNK